MTTVIALALLVHLALGVVILGFIGTQLKRIADALEGKQEHKVVVPGRR